jgi:glutamate 5-kinase
LCRRADLRTKPTNLVQKQALAAIGQSFMMRHYDDFFSSLGKRCAQVLLTLENLADRSQYRNARHTFDALFELGVIPVVNENDTVAVASLRFGDNDSLSAQVAVLVSASYLFLLTDVDGLYTANPATCPGATRIDVVEDIAALSADVSEAGTEWGTGGMATKLTAARLASAAGCRTVICLSEAPGAIARVLAGESIGTLFMPVASPAQGRKRWLLQLPRRGELWVSAAACAALAARKALFPSGVLRVVGSFEAQDAVRLCDETGAEQAVGLVNYSSAEAETMRGKRSREYRAILGFLAGGQVAELVHSGNVTFTSLAPDPCIDTNPEESEEETEQAPDGPSHSEA